MTKKKSKPAQAAEPAGEIEVPGVTITTVPVKELAYDPNNVRVHGERNKQALATSIEKFGAARSIVIDSDNVVRAGNGALEAAQAAGIENAIVVETDGSQLVVVKRTNWTPQEATAYAIADNRISDLSAFEKGALSDQLCNLQQAGFEHLLSATGFDMAEIAKFIDPSAGDQAPVSTDPIMQVVVDVTSEAQQKQLYDEFKARGFKCRVLTL